MSSSAHHANVDPSSARTADLSYSAYQLTLSTMIFPIMAHWVFDGVAGLCLALVGAPLLGTVWALCSGAADSTLQFWYRRWLLGAGGVDPGAGLRRLAILVGLRSALWMSAPLAFTLMTRSSAGVANTAVTALGLVALTVSVGWTSRSVFTMMAIPPALAIAIEAAVLLPAAPAAGVIIGLGVFAATMAMIAIGTHKAVGEWSASHSKVLATMADLEEALGRSEAAERRLRVAVNIADLYVYELDYATGVLTTQGDGSAFFERPQTFERLRDDPFADVHPDDCALVRDALDRYYNKGEPFRTEHRFNRSDGREVWAFSVGEVSLDEIGRPRTLVGALQNITERKSTERALILARDAAEAASRAKSDFLATMSHEIRTPLNGVLGMVHAMECDELAPTQRKRLDVIQESGETLLTILNAVLDIAKIEAGKLEIEMGEVDIAVVAQRALDPFTALASEKDITLSVDITPAAAGVYRGDPTRVGQVLHNLISNAVKFTHQGSVTLVVERHDDAIVLKVCDTGIGIRAESRTELFEKFSQVDASTTRHYGGTGLGLSIARELVNLMGGTIDLESEPGRGSTFIVTLALPRLSDTPSETLSSLDKSVGPVICRPTLRILAAEDNAINQLVLRTLLDQIGVDPTIVADGQQALDAWTQGEWDLILMDIQMPNMDGPTAARRIRQAEAESGRRPTPIIALTANVMDHQTASYRAAGMTEVVSKPIEVARLFQAIEASISTVDELQSASLRGR